MKFAGMRQLAIGATAAVVLAGGGTAAALASGSTPAHAASQAGSAARCAHRAARLRAHGRPQAAERTAAICGMLRAAQLLLHTIHGQLTVQNQDGSIKTIAVEQGVVQSVGGGVLTVKASDGTTWSWDLVASTTVRQHGSKAGDGALAGGQRVFVVGPVVGGANHALLIVIRAGSGGAPPA